MKRLPLKIFFCYSHQDAAIRKQLDLHLDLLEREGLVAPWHDGRISPGSEWSKVIQDNLRGSDLIVFLVSRAFLKSQYIAEIELRLALELHAKKRARLVPVLVEKTPGFDRLPLSKLEALPSKARPISLWRDRVRALDDVVAGIRRAALGLIIDSGGPFEFGSHEFSEAELADLRPHVRTRVQAGLKRLRSNLVDTVPRRKLERNLLVATWALNRFGRHRLLPESPFYLAQVITAFDVVALQEIDRDLEPLRELIGILGPEWGYFLTDVKEGQLGNMERIGILHYRPRVAFEHVSGEVVLPDDRLIEGRQFARKPLLASFRSGDFEFRICSAHIHFGGMQAKDRETGIAECSALADSLVRTSERERQNIVLAGNFNIIAKDSPAVRAFKKRGFKIPPRILHPTGVRGDRYYDMIGYYTPQGTADRVPRVGKSGSINPFQQVFRHDDEAIYAPEMDPGRARRRFEQWRTFQLSDHRPLWLELRLPRD